MDFPDRAQPPDRRGPKRKRRPIETVLADGDLPVSVGAGNNPDPEDLSALLSSLTPDQREAVWLRYVLDLSLTDAATVMGKAPEAVAALTHRAMERLRRTSGAP